MIDTIIPIVFKIPTHLKFFILTTTTETTTFSYFVGSQNAGRPLVIQPPAHQPLQPLADTQVATEREPDPDATNIIPIPSNNTNPTLLNPKPPSNDQLF